MSKAVNIYRLRLSKGTSDSHVPNWTIYDDEEKFLTALLDALLEAESRHAGKSRLEGVPHRLASIWYRMRGSNNQEAFGVNSVKADILQRGEWKELDVTLIPPKVEFKVKQDAN